MRALAPNDQMFLWLERRNQPMHIGGLQLLTPPRGSKPDWLHRQAERIRQFTQAQPPFNQQLTRRLGNWFWTEDKEFDVEGHFRQLALPAPGRIRELLALVSTAAQRAAGSRPAAVGVLSDRRRRGRPRRDVHQDAPRAGRRRRRDAHAAQVDVRGRPTPRWCRCGRWSRASATACAPSKAARALLAQTLGVIREQAATLPKVTRELYSTLREARTNPDYVSAFQAPRSILNQRITGSRRFAAQDYSLDAHPAAGKAHDATRQRRRAGDVRVGAAPLPAGAGRAARPSR